MRKVAIVGGGLTGLTVAHRLAEAGIEVTLFEASDRLGGQLSTAREDGYVIELGAEGFVARSEAVPRLATDVGIAGELLDQRARTSFRFDGKSLIALAPGEAAEALAFQVTRADRGAGIRTFVGGMQRLTDALAERTRERITIRSGHSVERVAPDGETVRLDGQAFDAIVLATTSAAAARLLSAIPEAPAVLAAAPTLSSVTVSLAFAKDQVGHALDGTGFVVAEPFEGFRASTFTSSKFAHRAPEEMVSIRVFFRPTPEELAAETPWGERARRVLGRVLPIEGEPVRSWVSIWRDALPVHSPELTQRIERIDAALAKQSLHLAGSAYHGSGICAAVRSAERVAAQILQSFA